MAAGRPRFSGTDCVPILCAVTDAKNRYVRNPYKLRLPDFLKSAIVNARSIITDMCLTSRKAVLMGCIRADPEHEYVTKMHDGSCSRFRFGRATVN